MFNTVLLLINDYLAEKVTIAGGKRPYVFQKGLHCDWNHCCFDANLSLIHVPASKEQ